MGSKGILLGTAGTYHVMSRLAVQGFHASCTHGNAPFVDIIVGSLKGDQTLSIQVKTAEHASRKNKMDFPLGYKAGCLNSENLFFTFVDMNLYGEDKIPVVYILPSEKVFEFCSPWIAGFENKLVRFQPEHEFIAPFKENWSQIEQKLNA